MKQNAWLRDPIWQFLGVVVGTAVSIALAVIGPIMLPDKVRLVIVIIVLLSAVFCLILVLRRTFGTSNQSPGLTVPKPQSLHAQPSPTKQTSHNDPIVIGSEDDVPGCGWIGLGSLLLSLTTIVLFVWVIPKNSPWAIAIGIIGVISILMCGVWVVWVVWVVPINQHECLRIGSEGIAYSGKEDFFLPWNEVSRVYIAAIPKQNLNSYLNSLYIELKDHSRLHFSKPIASRYVNGSIAICMVLDRSDSNIPKHLVEIALDIYTPNDVERSRK